jgi:hypothetical protein
MGTKAIVSAIDGNSRKNTIHQKLVNFELFSLDYSKKSL